MTDGNEAADVELRIEPQCEHCPYTIARAFHQARLSAGKAAYLGVLVEMLPGEDGKPWFLCIPCWLDGLIRGKTGEGSGRLVEGDPVDTMGHEGDLRCPDNRKKKRRSGSN